jgi:hypothetical protein
MNRIRSLFLALFAAAVAFAGSAFAADANVSGTWTMTVESPLGAGTPTMVLKQEGAAVTGMYKGQLGEAPITGTVKGNELTLNYKISAQGMELVVTYTGTVEGATAKGKVKYGDFGEGTFTGKKG